MRLCHMSQPKYSSFWNNLHYIDDLFHHFVTSKNKKTSRIREANNERNIG